MKPGLEFENSGMRLVCLAFFSLGKRNVGLFQRVSDGMYITARNTSKEANGFYSWAWGITSLPSQMPRKIIKKD